ncbi:MAG: hypothetical protein RQ847_00545 [Wenzhouxiangellaceae bacterium]|nr:hypothetical protein [Wenzhouxiangellaceae bacterium]
MHQDAGSGWRIVSGYQFIDLDGLRPVAMFCTGGIRCEKAGTWLKDNGFGEIYQLHGGILGYLAESPPETPRWRSECLVFDDRISVDENLRPTGRKSENA